MSQKIALLTIGGIAGLVAAAAIAPGSPPRAKKTGARQPTALVAQGHALFLTNCSPCHGADAEGDDGPSLHHQNLSDSFIAHAVKSGFKNEMPPFGGKLKPAEVKALVEYVHSLQK